MQCFWNFGQSRTTSQAVGAGADHPSFRKIAHTKRCMQLSRKTIIGLPVLKVTSYKGSFSTGMCGCISIRSVSGTVFVMIFFQNHLRTAADHSLRYTGLRSEIALRLHEECVRGTRSAHNVRCRTLRMKLCFTKPPNSKNSESREYQ
jgi:hypothetical protein